VSIPSAYPLCPELNENTSFVATTAQQYKWLETLYPKVFEKLKQKVKSGQFGEFARVRNVGRV
jgi:alpha-mannosidase